MDGEGLVVVPRIRLRVSRGFAVMEGWIGSSGIGRMSRGRLVGVVGLEVVLVGVGVGLLVGVVVMVVLRMVRGSIGNRVVMALAPAVMVSRSRSRRSSEPWDGGGGDGRTAEGSVPGIQVRGGGRCECWRPATASNIIHDTAGDASAVTLGLGWRASFCEQGKKKKTGVRMADRRQERIPKETDSGPPPFRCRLP